MAVVGDEPGDERAFYPPAGRCRLRGVVTTPLHSSTFEGRTRDGSETGTPGSPGNRPFLGRCGR